MSTEFIHGKGTDLEEFRINNYRFGVGIAGTDHFRIIAINCLKINSFSSAIMKLYISEEYLERMYYVLTRFSKRFFEEDGIPAWTKIKFKQEKGSFSMTIKLDKYTKTHTKVPCEDGLKKWGVTFTYEEVVQIFQALQEKKILLHVRDEC